MNRILLCLAAFTAAVCARAQETTLDGRLVDGVAAVVNQRVITLAEVRAAVAPIEEELYKDASHAGWSQEELTRRIYAARLDTLNKLIERALILDAFANYKGLSGESARIPEEIIDRRIREIIHHEFGGDRQLFLRTLQGRGLTMEVYRKEIRERIIVQFMREKEVGANVFVSPHKIMQYYQDNAGKYKVEEQVKLWLIFVRTGDGNRREVAQTLLQRLRSGEDFSTLAREHSEDRITSGRGGDLGWMTRKDLRPELSAVAFTLKPGEISEVIDTPIGFYLVKLEETKAAHVRPLAEVRDEIEKVLQQQERDRLHREWIDRLKRKAFIRLN